MYPNGGVVNYDRGTRGGHLIDAQANVCSACILFKNADSIDTVIKFKPITTTTCSGIASAMMPVQSGTLNGQAVTVLRDTGCSRAVVRKSLVTRDQLTGEMQVCMLADGSKVQVPVAEIDIVSAYFVGTLTAWCMENPAYDVIIGNIEGAREPNDPDLEWLVNAVETRAQKKTEEKKAKTLTVPSPIDKVTPEEIKKAQEDDASLSKIHEYATSGKIFKRNNSQVKYVYRNGLLHRTFEPSQRKIWTSCTQLVVPAAYRRLVLKLAHESIMAGHMGVGKTTSRLLAEFFWPGLHRDTKIFCNSCDICQKTLPKGRVGKVPLGKMPKVDIPFMRVAVDLVGP